MRALSRTDLATICLVTPLMAFMIALFIHVSREKYPVYPMALHPGIQPILQSANDGWPYRFRFINSQARIVVVTADANTNCQRDVELVGDVTGDGEVRFTGSKLHQDICAVVKPDQFPMVFECWPAPANAGSYNSCQRWN